MSPVVEANGARIPAIGLGTWPLRGEAALRAVQAALAAGYRHIDTAAMYGNEAEVGEAIATQSVPRDDIFITTKVWPTDVSDARLRRSAEASLKRLRLDAVDLLLIHWPSPDTSFAEQIRALCDAKKHGLARHVGVSNFPRGFLDAAVRLADEPIVVNQVEHHPWLDQRDLRAACARHGVAMTSYTPLGKAELLGEPAITEIASAMSRTAAQIVLRWHVQQPMNIAIPKSADPRRMAENIDIFDFALTAEDMQRIDRLARPDGRLVGSAVPLDWDSSPQV